jgi:hypothetical protein
MSSRCIRMSASLAILLAGVAACEEEEGPPAPVETVEALASPAGAGSSASNLTTGPDGRIHLSWIEPADSGAHALRFATLDGDGWGPPRTVASGTGWFVNWADFPAMTVLGDGRLAAHYLQAPAPGEGGSYAYHVRVVQSSDGGATWSTPVTAHSDRTLTEHGFASLFAAAGDSLGIIWLDGRGFDSEFGATEEMGLRSVSIAADGGMGTESLIDGRTCECCQTSVALTDGGPVVVYRNRDEGEVRDIHLSRLADGRWSEGQPVHRDGWEINGCPVNGPAVDSDGGARVVVAWFTGARDSARVYASFSEDRGDSFGAPIRVDGGAPVGRVDVEMLADGGALVSWIESGAEGGANVLVRRVRRDGTMAEPRLVTTSSGGRSSGFPRMAASGDRVVFSWTDPADPSQVRTAQLELGAISP